MPEICLASPPSPAELRRGIRFALPSFDPSLRILAEDVMGMTSSVDFVATDGARQVVLILIGDEGQDAALLTRGLAQRAFVSPRLGDWIQLAPNLDFRPDAPVRVILLSPRFEAETHLAVQSLREDVVQLAIYRCIENGTQRGVLLERLTEEPHSRPHAPERPLESGAPAFRSGLSESDLSLSPQELEELE